MIAAAAVVTALAGCSIGSIPATAAPNPRVVRVVAAEDFWGSIASQIGGVHAQVTSIVANPDADPHSYEPTARDGRDLAIAQLVIANGIGYDPWVAHLLAADPGHRSELDVGRLLGLRAGANPHRWYNPANVTSVVGAMTEDYARLDPADDAYFQSRRADFEDLGMRQYHQLVATISRLYAATPVGASESIVSMLAPALGLRVLTPPSFLRAVSEGADVTAADKTTIDHQIAGHRIRIYIYNSQNATPDVQAQLAECRAAGIPTATISETLAPAGSTYQAWQVRQLQGILAALEATRRP